MSRAIKIQKTEKTYSLKAIVITAIVSGMIVLSYNLLEDSLQRLIFSDKNELEYEILSSKELIKAELNKIVDANFEYSKLDLLFDDSIIKKYQYTVLELRNKW